MGSHLNGHSYRSWRQAANRLLAFDADRTAAANSRAFTCRQAQRARRERSQSLLAEGHDPTAFFVENGDARQFRSLLEAALPMTFRVLITSLSTNSGKMSYRVIVQETRRGLTGSSVSHYETLRRLADNNP